MGWLIAEDKGYTCKYKINIGWIGSDYNQWQEVNENELSLCITHFHIPYLERKVRQKVTDEI